MNARLGVLTFKLGERGIIVDASVGQLVKTGDPLFDLLFVDFLHDSSSQ